MELENLMVVDYGTSTSTVRVFKNNSSTNPIADPNNKNRCLSMVAVSKGNIQYVSSSTHLTSNKVLLKSTKRLLGKTRKELNDNMLREELYGAPVMFDEEDRPYFHCNIGTEKNHEYCDVYPEEVFGVILKHMKEQAELRTENEMKYCCFTVPHFTTDRARRLMRQEAKKLKLECSFMMKEPTAAGIPFLIPENDNDNKAVEVVKEGETVLVYDFGGGTLDITIMRREGNTYKVIGTGGDSNLGGNDIDDCLFNYILAKYEEDHHHPLFEGLKKRRLPKAKKDLLMQCREVKEELSANEKMKFSYNYEEEEIEITRSIFENEIINKLLEKCTKCWKSTLRSFNLRPEDINHVLLVGGSSHIPAIQNLFSNYHLHLINIKKPRDNANKAQGMSDKPTEFIVSPQDLVVEGAMKASQLNLIENCIEEMMETDVGVIITTEDGRSVFKPHISRGAIIPTSTKHSHLISVNEHNNFLPIYRMGSDNQAHEECQINLADCADEFEWEIEIWVDIAVNIDGSLDYTVYDADLNPIGLKCIILSYLCLLTISYLLLNDDIKQDYTNLTNNTCRESM